MRDWLDTDLKYNWHPYTQMSTLRDDPPLLIERAKGLKLYDDHGEWYYDAISSWWCNVHGHGHPRLREAVHRQMAKLDHVLFGAVAHHPAIELAERLILLAPEGLTRVFYSDNGSTSVEVALKMSVQYWRNVGRPEKHAFVHLDHGYHGDTVGCMSVSGVDLFRDAFSPLLFPAYQVPTPYCYRCPEGCEPSRCGTACLGKLEALLREKADEIAGLILEPLLLGAGGMIVYPPSYLAGAARLATQYGVHLILDEVATGFGRTGTMFACEQAKVCPDFLCLSKGLTGGTLPLAATLTTEEVYDAFLGMPGSGKTFYHGHTYTGNPIGCALALASLDLFQDDRLLERMADTAPLLQAGMQRFTNLLYVGEARGIGMVAALELVRDTTTKEPLPTGDPLPARICREALRHHLFLRPIGNVIYLFLPQCATAEEVTDILHRLQATLETALTL
ncbi:MAG TPA: adenosylmethionine--8-amino-7-oxononanoate transaminase [Armatimonadota bacterium]|jgi:adenosylmethionine-8-amino-7-oxononanoate aminotransferase